MELLPRELFGEIVSHIQLNERFNSSMISSQIRFQSLLLSRMTPLTIACEYGDLLSLVRSREILGSRVILDIEKGILSASRGGRLVVIKLLRQWFGGTVDWHCWAAAVSQAIIGDQIGTFIYTQDLTGDDPFTFFGEACRYGRLEIAAYILNKTAVTELCNQALQLACRHRSPTRRLIVSSEHDSHRSLEIAKLVQQHRWGGSVDLDFDYALYGACECGDLEIARWAIQEGARDVNYALNAACQYRHQSAIELLISMGAYQCPWCHQSMKSHINK